MPSGSEGVFAVVVDAHRLLGGESLPVAILEVDTPSRALPLPSPHSETDLPFQLNNDTPVPVAQGPTATLSDLQEATRLPIQASVWRQVVDPSRDIPSNCRLGLCCGLTFVSAVLVAFYATSHIAFNCGTEGLTCAFFVALDIACFFVAGLACCLFVSVCQGHDRNPSVDPASTSIDGDEFNGIDVGEERFNM